MVTPIRPRSAPQRRLFQEGKARRERMSTSRQTSLDWKQNLRQACLDRARNNRRNILQKRRGMETSDAPMDTTISSHEREGVISEGVSMSTEGQEPILAQDLVTQELLHRGIGVVSPCILEQAYTNRSEAIKIQTPPSGDCNTSPPSNHCSGLATHLTNLTDDADSQLSAEHHTHQLSQEQHLFPDSTSPPSYYLNEDELYELMQEVEDEMQRYNCFEDEEALLLEEEQFFLQEEERKQQLLLQQQIDDFQQWEWEQEQQYQQQQKGMTDTIDNMIS